MPAPLSTTELLEILRKSGIVSAETLAKQLPAGELPPDPAKGAGVLIKHGIITQFQAKLLLAGRYRGFKLGQYIVRDQLGQGGMGAVYLAEHATLRRRVAVKVLAPTEGMNKVAVERFLREARAAAALDHPNIVRIFDVAQQGEMHFLAMEYVEGQTLDQIVEASGPMATGRAVELMLMAAAGLQHAYEKGFVHRDIKPANLIVAKEGTLKILDMGLARSQEITDKLTEILDKGAVVGTADYISPEQAINSPDLDIRADIYSLGATFYTIVTGRPPFEGNTTQKLVQHQMKEPPPLTMIDKTFPAGLSAVVAKMLKKKPIDRFQTPAELIHALTPWLSNTPRVVATLSRTNLGSAKRTQKTLAAVTSGSTGRLPRIRRDDGKRSMLPIFAGVGALLAALVVGGLIYYFSGDSADSTTPIIPAPPTNVALPPPSEVEVPPNVPPVKPPTSPPESPAEVKPTVQSVPPKEPGIVYQLSLAGRGSYTETGTVLGDPAKPSTIWKVNPSDTTGEGPFPPGWQTSTTENGGQYKAEILAGPPAALAVVAIGNAPVTLLAPELPTGSGKLKMRVEYRSDKPLTVRYRPLKPAAAPAIPVGKLEASPEFATHTLEADLPANSSGRYEFVSDAASKTGFAIAKYTTIDPTVPAGKSLVRLNLDGQQPFVQRTRNFKKPGSAVPLTVISESGPGGMPAGWYRWISQPGAVAEFFADGEPGAMSLGVRMVTGSGGAQINTPEILNAPNRVRFRMLYSTGPQSPGALVRFRPKEGAIWDAVDLPPTGGSWRLYVTDLDLRGATGGLFELANPADGTDGALRIREFSVGTIE